MTIKNKIIAMHIKNLFWEFDRMSSSGQQTLNNLAEVCGVLIYEEDEKEEKWKKKTYTTKTIDWI